ncbi:MAG: flagellar biosynthetic protein FliR [Paracoccaceae bacterium]
MNAVLQELFGFGQYGLMIVFFVFLRVGAAMAILPAVGEQSVPQRVRLVLTLAYTLVVVPAVIDTFPDTQPSGPAIGYFLITEVVAGLAIGISLRLFVLALQTAGSIAAQSTSLSQFFGAVDVDPQPAMGFLLVISGLALAVTYGLHVQAAGYLIFSYQVMAPGQLIGGPDFSAWGLAQVARAFSLAFSLAAPFVVASLIYNIALGAINKAMPQLMVSFVGAPAITAGGLILLFVTAPLMLTAWYVALEAFLANPFGPTP